MNGIDREQINTLAFRISQMHKTYQELCWRLAEVELYLEMGQQPSAEQIRPIAQNISEQNIPLKDLHWYLAEKILLCEHKWRINLNP